MPPRRVGLEEAGLGAWGQCPRRRSLGPTAGAAVLQSGTRGHCVGGRGVHLGVLLPSPAGAWCCSLQGCRKGVLGPPPLRLTPGLCLVADAGAGQEEPGDPLHQHERAQLPLARSAHHHHHRHRPRHWHQDLRYHGAALHMAPRATADLGCCKRGGGAMPHHMELYRAAGRGSRLRAAKGAAPRPLPTATLCGQGS